MRTFLKTLGIGSIAALLFVGCGSEEKDENAPAKKPQPAAKPVAAQPKETTPPPIKEKVKPKKIDPASLSPKLAKIYKGTTGINAPQGQWKKFHKMVLAEHGKPTVTVEMYGKPAYFWAAREGDVCVQFGYPQPDDLKASFWTTWQASIVGPPAPGLDFGEKMHAERNWNECISYAEGKEPEK